MNKRDIGRCVGVELEAEGTNLNFTIPSNYWTMHNEPSLRSGVEYVFARPTPEKFLKEAFDEWEQGTANAKFVTDSLRTSLHLHYSVSQFTIEQLYILIGIYWVLENLLVKANGPYREGNLFCLRVKDADSIVRQLIQDINTERYFATWGNNLRYAAFNLASLSKFGTIEYRFIRGVTSRGEMEMWTREMLNFTYKTLDFKSLDDFYAFFLDSPNRKFLRTFFSESFTEMLISACGGYLKVRPLMEENLVYVVELISALNKHQARPVKQKQFINKGEDDFEQEPVQLKSRTTSDSYTTNPAIFIDELTENTTITENNF